ncbi:BCCT family transporter [Alkalitalea saponilacus]|uniref:Choline/glycine/proline betaine transport protein n=1 Tax=Alkalitalea saponilacus TaxID=889453 RepID=A0A1T5CJS6_9BACT|nr:BCCT family transporter [Alkalitalea saponilacus]ASB49886.1 choline transporter [Alkalitalea saponilacus]SKB59586.1 choline/glycine/proline betaine transport protein [Alkalitalea saponilacus]
MKNRYFDIHGPVFWPATILIILFIGITLIVGEPMAQIFSSTQSAISSNFGWLFIIAVNFFFIFSLYIGFGKYGNIRLGGDDAEKEFSTPAWFAMLFSAGMGIGILFWGVAEPVFHYMNPPFGEGSTLESAEKAMNLTFLHWGFHAWGIYALVGLSLAFFAFNRKQPLTIRSVFLPLLGKRVNGPIGNIIDVFAVLATLFGLATSLGLGVKQVSGGLHHVFGTPNTVAMQVFLIIGITLIATISVVTGIKKGVRFLSEWNLRIAAILLLLVLIVGPTLFIFKSFIQNIGNYLNEMLLVSTWTEAYRDRGWQGSWTVFYWAWWISWSPFVGMFIARVSKGRTIREFIFGVLLVPSLITFLWLTAFGGSAIWLDLKGVVPGLGERIVADESTALFVFFENFPLSTIASIIGILLVMSFFVTSSDSGSLVIDSITAGGKLDAPVGQRIFWANTEGAVAAVLLIGGGLTALQTAAVTTGLPFLIILLVMIYSLNKGLKSEMARTIYLSKSEDKKSYEKKIAGMIAKRLIKKESKK